MADLKKRRFGFARLVSRYRNRLLFALVPALVICFELLGWLAPIDRMLLEQRYRWLTQPASGETVVIEIDADTIGAVGVWPFPRTVFADVISRLNAAGARTIALDVDFSARSTEADDAALRAAIAESNGRVILPRFVQQSRRGGETGAIIERSATQFADGTGSFGGVNVTPDVDSRIWHYNAFDAHDGTKRPSLAVLLAEGHVSRDRFLIDFGISFESVPHLSMTQILDSTFDPSFVEGRRVLIGATAIELGDQLPVPKYGFLPGVYVQALAAESMIKGRALWSSTDIATALGLLLLLPVGYQVLRRNWRTSAAIVIVSGAALVALATVVQSASVLVLNIAAWLVALAGWWLLDLFGTLREQAIRLFRQRMSGTYRRELIRRVVDDSFDGIVISDSLGRIESINRTAERILAIDASEVTGGKLSDIFRKDVHEEIWGRIQAGLIGEQFDLSIRHPDGMVIETEMVISTIAMAPSRSRFERRRTERRVYVITFRDITERKIAEESKSAALKEAMRANRAKSQFLANVSHELRTPLNAILGFSDLIRSQVFGALGNQRYVEYVESINHSGTLLLELINSILDISRMESGEEELKMEIFDVEALLRECKSVMAGLIAKSPRVLTCSVAPATEHISADRSLMRQVFVNLLTNAFKFTDERGEIRVEVGLNADREVVIEVSDNGFGIPEEERAAIFEPFHQSSGDYVRKSDGFGLGLFIVHRIVLAHGGRIEVESELDVGTTIRVVLPATCSASHRDLASAG
ncbi:CHASE2 domain-containing protein [Nisaea sediminum]|uniref:CHASE2 domain-containing protein n=1 Tax=Nisaea sediminum TaxID=2775867 RepID=UPI0018674687|nr:CHASE2 domain-containing protein [Nisaea sediminum]